ncbi:glycine cleavage system aminomethyltransferase GcvT [Puniceicoccaceae bacterium K14]|nr:glycine cleavage system aminomethyltransferase GcvT [Puniceicoccaceae bacterium K14]
MSDLKRTPLYSFNVAQGGRMVDFAGWEMPVQFGGILDEHKTTRAAAGLFDVSHMGEAIVSGEQATEFLDYVLTNDISSMEVGRVVYSLMCYENGGVVDDLLVYRQGADSYLLCLNASNVDKDVDWLMSHMDGFAVKVKDVSSDYGLIALQGKEAFPILEILCDSDLKTLKYYHFVDAKVAGVDCIVSRTGYTGEKGVELFVRSEDAASLAEALFEVGKPKGLVLAGLGARDSLRLEASYSLYGHEISEEITPVQANLMWTVKLSKKSDFVGKAALVAEKEKGPEKKIVFFKTGTRRIIRAGTALMCGPEVAGMVVSGTFSPVLNEGIGSALVDAKFLKQELSVDNRGKAMAIYATKPPFIELNPQA